MAGVPPQRIVVAGIGETAEIAYEYFTHDSPHEVVAFSVEGSHVDRSTFFGLPVVPLEMLAERFDPEGHRIFVAVSSTHLNRLRTRLYESVKSQGFTCASYVSSRAFVWHNVSLGENVFVFEGNVLQHNVSVGDNTILWSGNHVGHGTRIGANVFVASHVVISGFCEIGDRSFLGVNSTLVDGVKVGHDSVVGAGAVVTDDLEPRGVYVGNPATATGRDPFDTFSVPLR